MTDETEFATRFPQPWKRNLAMRWVEIGVPTFIDAIGFNFERDFLTPLEASDLASDPYEGYTWYLFNHPRLSPGVLHAHPASVGSNPTLWEEWFHETEIDSSDETLPRRFIQHHHLLRNHPHEGEEGQWRGIDDEHPAQVLDISWHYINSSNPTPSLL
jgi:hypothetical protein